MLKTKIKLTKLINLSAFVISCGIMFGCSALINAPTKVQKSTLGEVTPYTSKLKKLPLPTEKVVVAVYKFKDQTGQYKPSENNANWSTAIPQGTTSILMKALEDSNWFTTIERENIGDLLNERQIIKTTRQEYAQNTQDKNSIQQLPPLLFAGIIIEGGIISYDTNIMTGGAGLRYFGVGGGTQYRQDRLSVYLRAVSTNTGKILKTVYTTKTILSQSINGNFFRYVDPERLLEAEIGVTKNEPVHLAVKEAIEKSVYDLVIEGVKDNLWGAEQRNRKVFFDLIEEQAVEDSINNSRFDNIVVESNRGRIAVFGGITGNYIKNDFNNNNTKLGYNLGAKVMINENVSLSGIFSNFTLENKGIFSQNFNAVDLDLEYLFLPKNKFTPYINGGIGLLTPTSSKNNDSKGKVYIGGGFEFLPHPSLGIRAFGKYDFGFTDDWDNYISGKRKDNMIVFGAGLIYYMGKKMKY